MAENTSIVYQKNNNTWVVTDTCQNSLFNVVLTDLNGDGKKDLKIVASITAAGANSENVVFIFNPRTAQFVHNSYYDLPNIKYDKSKKEIRSAWWASANRPQEKMTYRLTGDSLRLDKGVKY